MGIWKVRDAKARFSDLLRASGEEPQIICNRDKKLRAVIDIELFDELMELKERGKKPSLRELMGELQKIGGVELDLPPRTDRPLPEGFLGSDDDEATP